MKHSLDHSRPYPPPLNPSLSEPLPNVVEPLTPSSRSIPIEFMSSHTSNPHRRHDLGPTTHPYPSTTTTTNSTTADSSTTSSPLHSAASSTTDLMNPTGSVFKRTGSAADLYLRTVNTRYGTNGASGSISPPKWTPRGLRPCSRGSRSGTNTPSLSGGVGSLSSSPGTGVGMGSGIGMGGSPVLQRSIEGNAGEGMDEFVDTATAAATVGPGGIVYQKFVPEARTRGRGGSGAESSLKRLFNASRAPPGGGV